MSKDTPALIYTGDGRFLAGFPAADISDDELAELAKRFPDGKPAELRKALIDSGLYKAPGKAPVKED